MSKGQVKTSNRLNLIHPKHIKSSPEHDTAMLRQIKLDRANPQLYNIFFSNCIEWAIKAIRYGMDAESDNSSCVKDHHYTPH